MEKKLCVCGCGELIDPFDKRGRERNYKNYHCSKGWLPKGVGHRGPAHPRWKSGRLRSTKGYIRIWAPDHPYADCKGYVNEHRLIMEEILGRYLWPFEDVHHINGIKYDNRPENLDVLIHGDHSRYHLKAWHTRTGLVRPINSKVL